MEHITLGLQLLIVGMLTVFAILLIVIFGGKLLIRLVNMIAPEEVASAKKTVAPTVSTGVVDPSTMAILQEVVKQITGGKGKVESARKV